MAVITCIEDLRVLAKRACRACSTTTPTPGSWTEGTYRANEADFQAIKLRQRVAVNMENRSTARDDGRRGRGDAGGARAGRA